MDFESIEGLTEESLINLFEDKAELSSDYYHFSCFGSSCSTKNGIPYHSWECKSTFCCFGLCVISYSYVGCTAFDNGDKTARTHVPCPSR